MGHVPHQTRERASVRACALGAAGAAMLLGAVPNAVQAADGRAFELVSPPGGVAELNTERGGLPAATPDGNAVCFTSAFPMAGAPPVGGTQVTDAYCARRGADGWAVEWISQPRGRFAVPTLQNGATAQLLSEDGSRALFDTTIAIGYDLPQDLASAPTFGYLRAGGATTPISLPALGVPVTRDTQGARVHGGSADLRHILFTQRDALQTPVIKEWVDGAVRDVIVAADGTAVPGTLAFDGTGDYSAYNLAVPGTISRDGRRIFFQAGGGLVPGDVPEQTVYLRADGVTSIVSERLPGEPSAAVSFAGASDDGAIAYLTTTERLTAPAIAGTAIYRRDVDTGTTALVADDVASVLAVSRDGSSVFFSGTDVLEPGEGLSLYVARGGAVTRISPLSFDDTGFTPGLVGSMEWPGRSLRVTRDGSAAAFRAFGDGTEARAWRWSADDGLALLSRDLDGNGVDAQIGGVVPPMPEATVGAGDPLGRGITEDGETVFLTTDAALVAADVNETGDVYAWNAAGGMRLITSGTARHAKATYIDSSADGSTVFFMTYERVLPQQDTNSARDLYVARVGGGFPWSPQQPCSGDACQGPLPAPPAGGLPASETHTGPGDVEEPERPWPRPMLRLTRVGSGEAKQFARSGRLTLRVQVRGSGTVSATASAPIGRRSRRVASARRIVVGDGTARLTLQLSRAARRQLAAGRRLRVTVAVRLSGAAQRTTTMTLSRKVR